jgi:hypothetical protein
MADLRYYPTISMEGRRKTTKYLGEDIRPQSRDLVTELYLPVSIIYQGEI